MTISRRAFLASASCTLAAGCMDAPSSGPGGGEGGGGSLRCLFVTDAFSDSRPRQHDFNAIAAAGYNAVCALIDLQLGDRANVVAGRTKTDVTATARYRVSECRAASLLPVVMIRNDWGDDHGKSFPSKKAGFYSGAYLEQEKAFLTNMAKSLGTNVGVQLSIEGTAAEAAPFNFALATHAADLGFKTILVNLLGAAQANWHRHPDAKTAHSWHGLMQGKACPHDILNTDGDRSITPATADAARKLLTSSGKGWILWSDAIIHGSVDKAFLKPL